MSRLDLDFATRENNMLLEETTKVQQMTRVSGAECRDWPRSSRLEWLETNGTGGFAMGTVSGANTRRYHGLLVASMRPPVERRVLLARVEEELLCNGESANLGAAQYPGAVNPAGFHYLEDFRLDPFPVWTYKCSCATVEKRFFLKYGEQTAVLQYRVSADCRLRVRPFLAWRDYHSLQREGPVGPPLVKFHQNSAGFVPVAHWYYNNEYLRELDRGLDYREDLYSPGWFDFELRAGETAYVVATLEDHAAVDARVVAGWENAERQRRAELTGLEGAAEQFLVRRKDGSRTVIAGYPWFTDWGRDTMIALPGLLIARGRKEEAREILEGFLEHMDQGLIPNRFPDVGEKPEYNTADGTLWLFQAGWAYGEAGGDVRFLYEAGKEILKWHFAGTHFGIKVDPLDGLLAAGGPGTQLTWMDAKVGDWVVTPRDGKAVEINALWYNALRIMAAWARKLGERTGEWEKAAQRVAASFKRSFWNGQYLYDRLGVDGPDARVRPNQIFALSLAFPVVEDECAKAVLGVVEEKLLTSVGLRTLAPGEADYKGRYEGGPAERDGAYHQGTVWPWLLGPYLSARLRVNGHGDENLRYCEERVSGMLAEMDRGCLGTLAEIYDGDEPRRAVGAPAQAWSVAEMVRVSEELRKLRLKY